MWTCQVAQWVKNPPAKKKKKKEFTCSARDTGDMGLTPELERFPGEGNSNPSSILTWRIPCTEESGGLQCIGSQKVKHDLATEHTYIHTQTHTHIGDIRILLLLLLSHFSRVHGLQPTRLLHPWDFPSKSTGVVCHHFLQ